MAIVNQFVSHRKSRFFFPVSYKDYLDKSLLKDFGRFSGLHAYLVLSSFLDFLQVSLDDFQNFSTHEAKALASCGDSMIFGTCSTGHEFGKVVVCGRQWCSRCGRHGSERHMQRFARILPKIQQFQSMGMFVVQLPLALRSRFRDKESLKKFSSIVARHLKGLGFSRGIYTWDFFGDPKCPSCLRPGKPVKSDGVDTSFRRCPVGHTFHLDSVRSESMGWNPHLNILVEAEILAPEVLSVFKEGLAVAFGSPLIVNYHYVSRADEKRIPKMLHHARYATKPTFYSLDWDFEAAVAIRGMRSVGYWGTWKGEPAWELEEKEGSEGLSAVVALEKGVCPVCSAGIVWGGIVRASRYIEVYGWAAVGGGVFFGS